MLCKYTFFTKITKYYLGGKGRVTIQNTMYLGIVAIMIHQISCLAPDWSKHTTWSINLQLKHPSNIPQFSNLLRYGKSSFHIKLETREGFVVVREERTFFCSLSRIENTQKKTSHTSYSKLFIKFFSTLFAKYWRIINTIASIMRQNMHFCFSLDIICSSKFTIFLEFRSRKTVRPRTNIRAYFCTE